MYVKNGIAYAGESLTPLKICGVRAKDDYILWVRFNNGEEKNFNFKPLLSKPAYKSLSDIQKFKEVYIDYGIPVWDNGNIDIAPEYLYENGICVNVAI